MEVFNVIYKGPDELKPDRQIGTIKVQDDQYDHYLYRVDNTDISKKSVQPLDYIVLTGPSIASISANHFLTIDVDLFCGVYKDSFCIEDCQDTEELRVNTLQERKIVAEDGRGEIYLLYAVFDNATEACIEIRMFAKDNSFCEVYGIIAASTSKFENPEFSSILFLQKPDDKIKLGTCELFPLSRFVVAVPLISEFILDIHLLNEYDDDIFEGTVKFAADRAGTCKKSVFGKSCELEVKVTWKCGKKFNLELGDSDGEGIDVTAAPWVYM